MPDLEMMMQPSVEPVLEARFREDAKELERRLEEIEAITWPNPELRK